MRVPLENFEQLRIERGEGGIREAYTDCKPSTPSSIRVLDVLGVIIATIVPLLGALGKTAKP